MLLLCIVYYNVTLEYCSYNATARRKHYIYKVEIFLKRQDKLMFKGDLFHNYIEDKQHNFAQAERGRK